jgi:predicted membrane-bound spermidine synthase
MKKMKMLAFGFAVFVNGAAIMGLELLAIRILAPYVGTTVGVWSAIIAVMLAAIGVGYLLGGALADRRRDMRFLSLLFFAGSFSVLLIIFFKEMLLLLIAKNISYGLAAVASSLALFFLPGACLGMITTYVLRMETHDIASLGESNGTLYALSTLGSLFGVFGTSLYLVPTYSVSRILYGISGALFLMACIFLGAIALRIFPKED